MVRYTYNGMIFHGFAARAPRFPDSPIITALAGFMTVCGIPIQDVIGQNCRFLNKGCRNDPAVTARLMAEIWMADSFSFLWKILKILGPPENMNNPYILLKCFGKTNEFVTLWGPRHPNFFIEDQTGPTWAQERFKTKIGVPDFSYVCGKNAPRENRGHVRCQSQFFDLIVNNAPYAIII